jgi:parallel beta-helix repeat protein
LIKRPNPLDAGRGAYSAIIYRDGDYSVAEYNEGTLISENTNAKTTIQAAINALTTGGDIYITKGEYDILSEISVNQSNINIHGEGKGTILKQTGDFNYLVHITTDNCSISAVKIDGNKSGITTSSANVVFNQCDYGEIFNCYVINSKYYAIRLYKTGWGKVLNNHVLATDGRSIYLGDINTYAMVQNNVVQNSGAMGIFCEAGVTYSQITGNIVKDAAEFGIGIYNGSHNVLISSNTVISSGLDNISVQGCDYTVVSGNISKYSGESGICYAGECDYGAISGNTVSDNYHFGLNLESLRYFSITGNAAKNNSLIASNYYAGIAIRSHSGNRTATNNVATGNFSSGVNQSYGISLDLASDDYNMVVGNHVRGNVSGGVYNPTAHSMVEHNIS